MLILKSLGKHWQSKILSDVLKESNLSGDSETAFYHSTVFFMSDDLINREPTASIIYKWLSCQIFTCYCKLFKITVIAWGNLTFILQFATGVSQPSKIFHFRCCALLSTNTCQTCHHFRIKGVASVGNFILQFGFSF